MKKNIIRNTSCLRLALFGMTALALGTAGRVHASEVEPNDTFTNANLLSINSTQTGNCGSGDVDYFVVTNTNNTFTTFDFQFDGSSPDTMRMKVFALDGVTLLSNQITDSNTFSASYSRSAAPGAKFYVAIQKNSADGTKPYSISTEGSDALLNSRSMTVPKEGSTQQLSLTLPPGTTNWSQVVGGLPSWVTIQTFGPSKLFFNFTVAPNPLGSLERSATLDVLGAKFQLTQEKNPVLESESNDTPVAANVLSIPSNAEGAVGSGDIDYFKFTNPGNVAAIGIDFGFDGSGSDTCRLMVLASDGVTPLSNQLTDSNTYKASYRITAPPAGETYYVAIQKNSADGTKSYTLAVKGIQIPDIAVKSPSGRNLTSGDLATFGTVRVGNTSTKTFTIVNKGKAKLTGIKIFKNGANKDEFVTSPLPKHQLAPGRKMTFTVTFSPTAANLRKGLLKITSNDPDENPFIIVLDSKGKAL